MQPQHEPNKPAEAPLQTPQVIKSHSTIKIVLIIVAALCCGVFGSIALGALAMFTEGVKSGGPFGGSQGNMLYTAFWNAAQKTKVQQHTEFKVWKEGAPTSELPKKHEISLTGFDNVAQTYATINADTAIRAAEKCIDGKPYFYRPTTNSIDASVAILNDPQAKERISINKDPADPFSPCSFKQNITVGKISDGVIPVGATADQASSWINKLKASETFVIKDEGKVEFKGKKLHKMSLELGEKQDTSSLLYAVRDGDTGKTFGSGIDVMTQFGRHIAVGLITPTKLKGFYLIDEQSYLPVYSELQSVGIEGKKLESFIQKTDYAYPDAINMTKDTKLTTF